MKYHKLLEKQIKKHLTENCLKNEPFKNFIQAVNDSYMSFERDKDILNHAFKESEEEYHEINSNLKEEYELKKQSIANLYESIRVMDEEFESLQNEKNEDELLFISKLSLIHI